MPVCHGAELAATLVRVSSARIPIIEICSLDQFDAHIASSATLRRCAVESVDLNGRAQALTDVDVRGALFLGCTMTAGLEDDLAGRGGLIFPPLPDVPFNPYRSGLYDATELYGTPGTSYSRSRDGRVYAWYTAQGAPAPLSAGLAMSLHDQAIGEALDDLLASIDTSHLVGVLGGHAARRGNSDYALAAKLGAHLAGLGYAVATGGGPGAMEAANLGARLGDDPARLDEALTRLDRVPDFAPDITAWAAIAQTIADEAPAGGLSLGIPTWFYGHEPPNAFATHIAKYFSNALREDVLLSRCLGGLVYLPGAAGTVQEIFQCATRDYYAPPSLTTPLVLVGRDYWTQQLPAWPLLQSLGQDRMMGQRIALVDTVEEVAEALSSASSQA